MSISEIMRRAEETQREIQSAENARRFAASQAKQERERQALSLFSDPSPLGYRRVEHAYHFLPGKTIEMVFGRNTSHLVRAGAIEEIKNDGVRLDIESQLEDGRTDELATIKFLVHAWHWRELPKPEGYTGRWPKSWLFVELRDGEWSKTFNAVDLLGIFWVKDKGSFVKNEEKRS